MTSSLDNRTFEIEPSWRAIILVDTGVLAAAALGLYFLSGVGGDLTVKLAAGLILIAGVLYVFFAQFSQLTIQFSQDGVRRTAWIGKRFWEWRELEDISSSSAGFELLFSDGARVRILRALISNDAALKKFLEARKSTVI